MPEIIERALAQHQAQVNKQPVNAKSNSGRMRDSIQRKRYWWLPYVVLEFDKNEILVDALGGDISTPSWLYKANLSVFVSQSCIYPIAYVHPSDVSRTSGITVSAYLRTSPSGVTGENHPDMGNDILLARVDLTPTLDSPVRLPLMCP
jgi:serum/glucocorticoid-regulated kinase 2